MTGSRELEHIDAICGEFEAVWRSGKVPVIAEFLSPDVEHSLRIELLHELVAIDLAYRWGQEGTAEALYLEDYFRQFPQLKCHMTGELIAEEYRCRVERGDVERGEYLRRFPEQQAELPEHFRQIDAQRSARALATLHVRCPHCHSPQSISVDESLDDIQCSSCRDHFSLTGSKAAGPLPRQLRHFELLKQVGSGSFGAVWKARDTKLDRIVAVKVPLAGAMQGDDADRFFREARAAAQLKHPNIVSVHDAGFEGGIAYIVIEFQPGQTLAQRLLAEPFSQRESVQICYRIATALDHAHQQGVVHRDLKPANIILDAAAEPHVTDFGLASRRADEVTMTLDGKLLGTPAYMAPEQARGAVREIDAGADVYALGVILYELLTGLVPFREDLRTVLVQVMRQPPPGLRKLNRHIARDLETICLKCLEKSPWRRYATAGELADDLGRCLRGEPILARPITPPARAARWCKRHPLPTAIAALCLLSVTLGTAMLMREFALGRIAAAERRAKESAEQLAAVRREQTYRTQIVLAEQALNMGDLSLVSTALEECPPDLRGWEWRLLDCLLPTSELTLGGHSRVFHLSYSADGAKLASAGDSTIRLWDASTGKPLWVTEHEEATTVAIHPTQSVVISSGHDGWLVVHSLETGEALRRIEAKGQANWTMRMQPQGRLLAGGGDDGKIHLWDTATWEQLPSPGRHLGRIRAIDWSPDGNRLTSTSEDGQWKLFDLRAGAEETIPLSYACCGRVPRGPFSDRHGASVDS